NCCKTQDDGMEGTGFGLKQNALGMELRFGIQGDRNSFRLLVHYAFRGAVDTATRSKQKPLDAVAFGDLQHHARCRVVRLESVFVIFSASRVPDYGSKVDYVSHAFHCADNVLDVAAITFHEFELGIGEERSDSTITVEEVVQQADRETQGKELADDQRTDVTGAADTQDALLQGGEFRNGMQDLGIDLQQPIFAPTNARRHSHRRQ